MEFDKSKVYTALNATEDLIGAKGYFADYIGVSEDSISDAYEDNCFSELKDILNYKFVDDDGYYFNFFYLVEPAPIQGQLRNDGKEVYYNGQWIKLEEPAPEKWYVYITEFGTDKLDLVNVKRTGNTVFDEIQFKGTKEECKQFIAEHSKKYRPFKDCDELIETWKNKMNGYYEVAECPLDLPTIWVKLKAKNRQVQILGFENDEVLFTNGHWNVRDLLRLCTFLDGSVCGVEE